MKHFRNEDEVEEKEKKKTNGKCIWTSVAMNWVDDLIEHNKNLFPRIVVYVFEKK